MPMKLIEITTHYRPNSENIYQEFFNEEVVVKSHNASHQKRVTKVNYYPKNRKLIVRSFYVVNVYNAS